jgi:hypothetical protein
MKKNYLTILLLCFAACSSRPTVPGRTEIPVQPAISIVSDIAVSDELDDAIEAAADYLNKNVSAGNKLVILNFRSNYPSLSEYIIDVLTGFIVNERVLTVVDRVNLALIQQEMDFQLSGEVSDSSAQSIGQKLGAQTIVSGSITAFGDLWRLSVRALDVESAQVQGQFNRNMASGPTIAALAGSSALAGSPTLPGNTTPGRSENTGQTQAAVPGVTASGSVGGESTTQVAASAEPAEAPAAPGPTVSDEMSRPGLYVGTTFQDQMDLYDALDWIILNAQNNGNYTIVLDRDQAITYTNLDYSNKTVTVSLKSTGGQRTVSFEVNSPSYPLFTVSPGVTFILEDGVVLSGENVSYSAKNLVRIAGGRFIMNGGTLRDNETSAVYVESGDFTMNGGIISGNSATTGGGVYVQVGTFTMQNGVISGNTARDGGGVYVNIGGTFTKSGSGGIIYGSNAPEEQANKAYFGHAVYSSYGQRIRNTTARISTALDPSKSGAAGGWE